jgi:hypothetical protein
MVNNDELPELQQKDGASAHGLHPLDLAVQRRVEERIQAAVRQSTAAIPIEEDIDRAARSFRRTDAYKAYVYAGAAEEIRKLWKRIFMVTDYRSRWTAAEEMNKADAEGVRRVGVFLQGFEELVATASDDLRSDWAKGIIEDTAAVVAVAVRKRVNTILGMEAIRNAGS